jgi:hypothetical protein
MAATIAIDTNAGPLDSVVIHEAVTRIGADPTCQVSVPLPAAHAATIRYEDGIYAVYNRGQSALNLYGTAIRQGEHIEWSDGEALDMGHGVVVTLHLAGNGAPEMQLVNQLRADIVDEFVDDESQPKLGLRKTTVDKKSGDSAPKAQTSSLSVFLAICLVALLALLFVMPESSTRVRDEGTVRAEFKELVGDLAKHTSDEPMDYFARANLEVLQEARVQQLRGNPGSAQVEYQLLRDLLLPRRGGDGRFKRPLDGKLYEFVMSELDGLSDVAP